MNDQGELFPEPAANVKDRKTFALGGPVEEQLARQGVINAVDSPVGRIMRDSGEASVRAAAKVPVRGHRALVLGAVRAAGPTGRTSIEAARYLTAQTGTVQVSNRTASRLGELWEAGLIAIQRERGVCVLGGCRTHAKPGVVHRPTAACLAHGKPILRDGASVWVAL